MGSGIQNSVNKMANYTNGQTSKSSASSGQNNYNSQGQSKSGWPLSRQGIHRYGTQAAIADNDSIGGASNRESSKLKHNGRASSQNLLLSSNSAGNPPNG